MNIRHNEVIIPEEKGSDSFINCKLDRKKYADILTNLINTYSSGFVMAVNNKWGTGKTTFMKMWRQDLKNKCYKTLYFNAWENDFQDEVIIALLSELEEFQPKAEEKFSILIDKAALFLTKVAPIVAKGVASKAIGNEAVSEIIHVATEYTAEEIKKNIEEFNEKKKGILEFRKSLNEFVCAVDNQNPVVFIIDELDRCRPNYAVKILEKIKHLFSVEGIIFVISIDKIQLKHAIRGVYGNIEIDSEEYLRRFIDLEYTIPEPDVYTFVEYLYEYFDFKSFFNSEIRLHSNEFKDDSTKFKSISGLLLSNSQLSLRQIEKIISRLRIVLNTFSSNQYVFPELLILIGYMDLIHLNLLQGMKNKIFTFQDVSNTLDNMLIPFKNEYNERKLVALIALFLVRYEISYKNYKPTSQEKLIDIDNTGKINLVIESKFNNDEGHLLRMINFYYQNMNVRDIGLDYILSRYYLTENIITH